jgi:hypothetical protein
MSLCPQEIADNYPDPSWLTVRRPVRAAAALFDATAVAGIAVDHPGDGPRRRRFGT